MDFYNLLPEPEETKRFLELLPEHGLNECLTVAVFLRKKYVKDNPEFAHLSLSNDDGCWERTIVAHTKKDRHGEFGDKVFRAILGYVRPVGAFVDRNGVSLPEDVLSLYMSVNPRCAIKGTRELMSELNRQCFLPTSDEVFVGNIVSRAKTMVQKNASRKDYADIDIDVKDESVLHRFRTLVQDWGSEVCTIETRGGFHILTDIEKMTKASDKWYMEISNLTKEYIVDGKETVEFKTDTLVPIVGSRQGGFVVKLV